MRAVMFHRCGQPLTLETVSDPVPGRGEVVIEVGRCGICGSDVHLTHEPGYYAENSLIGHEYAGTVVAVGKDVERYRIGDVVSGMPLGGCGHCRLCGLGMPLMCQNPAEMSYHMGAFADFVRVSERWSLRVPSSLSMADGALVEPLAVGLHAVAVGDMRPGSRILVTGAGSIGLAAVYWARKLGAGKIAVLARTARSAEIAMQMGADFFVQASPNEGAEIAEALGGPPEIVIETVGAQGALATAIDHAAVLGKVISVGCCTKPDPILPVRATGKHLTLIFSMAYSLAEFTFVADMLDRGHLEPRHLLGVPIPLSAVPDQIARMRTQSPSEIKVHCDPSL